MTTTKITQSDITEFIASTEEFWNTFNRGLKAPFCYWNDHKNCSVDEWSELIKNTDDVFELKTYKDRVRKGFKVFKY